MSRVFSYSCVLIAIIIAVSLWFLFRPQSEVSAPSQVSPITVATSTIRATNAIYDVQAVYPIFGVPALDAKIKQTVDAGVSDLETAPANPSPNGTQNEFNSGFDHVYVGRHH